MAAAGAILMMLMYVCIVFNEAVATEPTNEHNIDSDNNFKWLTND